jgi:hypothetical protein
MEFEDDDVQNSQNAEDFSFEKQPHHSKKKVKKVTKKRKSHKTDAIEENKDEKIVEEIKEEIKDDNSKNDELKENKEEKINDSKNEEQNETKDDTKENNNEKSNEEEKKEEPKESNEQPKIEIEEKTINENDTNEQNKNENENKEEIIQEKAEEKKSEEKPEEKKSEEKLEEKKSEENDNNIIKKEEEKKEPENKEKSEQPKPEEQKIKEGPKKISEFDLINQDPYLKNFEWCIKRRNEHFKSILHQIESNEKSLENFSNSYQNMGLHVLPNGDIKYREYAPGAKGIALFGEFNNWNRDQYWAKRDQYGFWELIIPNEDGKPRIKHNTKVKCNVVLSNGQWADRNPIWIEYLYQNSQSLIFDGVFWNPEEKYEWKYPQKHLPRPKSLRIYEAHIGMSSFYPKITTYKDFAENLLPRIKKLGYTAVQLMAIMHHANYASFGYHVNNFFAISSLFGTPEDLMYLIDKAHEMGLFMIMDIVHSHASSNVDDGFNNWDGTDYLWDIIVYGILDYLIIHHMKR